MTRRRLFLAAFAVGCVLSGVALASDVHHWSPDSYVMIVPSDRPGAVAEVLFLNDGVHKYRFNGASIGLDGLPVTVMVETNTDGAADTMTVTPPPGFIAVPESITVDEGGAGVVTIYEEGMS